MNIGIIGTGNLGKSLANMVLNRKIKSLICSVRRTEQETELKTILKGNNISFTTKNKEVAQKSNCVFLSVKPGQTKEVCEEIRNIINPNTAIISVAAGIPLFKLRDWLPHTQLIIRCMPNISCGIDKGVIPYMSYGNPDIIDELTNTLFKPNLIVPLKTDDQIDMSTLISGCAPAIMAWYINCLRQFAGDTIPDNDINNMLTHTMIGTASLLQKQTCTELINSVASPKGATEAILTSFQMKKIDTIISDSLLEAHERVHSITRNL